MARSRAARLGQAVLDLVIDDSKFHSKLSGAHKAAQDFTAQAGSNLTKAGRAISDFGGSWSRNVTLPIVAAGGIVSKFGLDFDTTMNEVVALTSVTSDQIGGIREELIKLGPEVGKSPQELADAFYFVASAGFEGAEALEVTREAAKAAAAGLGDTATVAKVVGTAINAYGRDNITAAEATDTLVAAIGEGSAEAPEFAGALGNVIGSAAQIGAKFSDVTAAIAAMTNVGIGAEESVTSLNQVFVSLFKPTAEAAEALEGMGLSAASLRTMIAEQGLLPTLTLLADKFEGNAEATATVFGNVRALRGVLALTGGDAEKTAGIFDRMQDTVGATGEAFDQVASSDAFKFRQAMASLEATAIELGADVLPIVVEVLQELAGMARGLAKAWGDLDDDTRQFIVRALAVLAVIGPVLIVVGKLTTGLGALIRAVGFLGGAKGIPKLNGTLIKLAGVGLGPIGVIVALGAALHELGKGITAATSGLEDEFIDAAQDAGIAVNWAEKAVQHLANEFGVSAGEIQERILAVMESTGVGLEEATVRVRRALETGFEEPVEDAAITWAEQMAAIQDSAYDGTLGAAAAIDELPPEVVATLEAAGIPIGDAAGVAMDGIDEEAAAARQAALDHMQSMLSGIAGMFDSNESVREAWQSLIDRMDDPYTEAERKADIFGTDMTNGIRGGLESGDPALIADTVELVNRLLGEFALLEPGALESGEAVPPGLRSGMDKEMSALIRWIETNVTGESLAAMELDAVPQGLEGIAAYARGMRQNQIAATSAARNVAMRSKEAMLDPDWYGGGQSSALSWASGFGSKISWQAAYGAGATIAAAAGLSVRGLSPPKEGPLSQIDKDAFRVAMAWVGGWEGALGPAEAVGARLAGAVGSGLTPGWHIPAMTTPALPDLAALSSTLTAAEGLGVTIEHREYHLHYSGRELVFDTPDAFLRELQSLDRFDEEGT